MQVYGAVEVNGVEYHDDEMLDIPRDQPFTSLSYEKGDWDYLGDQDPEDSNILVVLDDKSTVRFDGTTGLNDFLSWLAAR